MGASCVRGFSRGACNGIEARALAENAGCLNILEAQVKSAERMDRSALSGEFAHFSPDSSIKVHRELDWVRAHSDRVDLVPPLVINPTPHQAFGEHLPETLSILGYVYGLTGRREAASILDEM